MPRVGSRSLPRLLGDVSGTEVSSALRNCGSVSSLAKHLDALGFGPALQGRMASAYIIELFEDSFSLSVVQRVELRPGYL